MSFDSKIFWKETRAANRAINDAAVKLRTLAGQNLQKYTDGYSDKLLGSLRTQVKRKDGEINTIKLGTLRYGIIREYGAGRGWPGGVKTSGESERARTRAPWLAESFDAVVPALANRLAKIKGDDMVKFLDDEFTRQLGRDTYRIEM